MKYTIFIPCEPSFLDTHTLCVLEGSINLFKEGHQITLIDCDGRIPLGCCFNNTHDKGVCKNCIRYKKSLFKLLPKGIKIISMSEYISSITGNYDYKYDSVNDIKKCEYKGVEIGYCCLSSYIFITRNLYPLVDDEFKQFFDVLMHQACQYTDMLETIINDTKPDVLGCFNNRFVYCRPIVNTAQNKNIDYIIFEWWTRLNGERALATFSNVEVHDLANRYKLLYNMWEDNRVPLQEKVRIAERFYNNRRNSVFSGDKLYVKDQVKGQMPNQWDNTEQNIVIFNSSEDEMASLGKVYEKDKEENLFITQYQGLEYLANHFKDYKNIHFYLRIHPNLKRVNYLYHTKLYHLESLASNFTVIPANSTISTYSLIDAADKVIVFGSTTGIEASYWGRPVILLSNCIYKKLNCCYCPNNIQELNELITATSLKTKRNDEVLKYAYYCMNDYFPEFKTYKHKIKRVRFLNHDFEIFIYDYNVLKKLWFIVVQIIGKRHLFPKYHNCPAKEDANAKF